MLTVSLLVCAMVALARADDASIDPTVSAEKAVNISLFASASCTGAWKAFGNHCYLYNTEKLSWAQAQKNCQDRSGNLASIHSQDEYNFIQQMTTASMPQTWIGGSDCQEGAAWFWIDGTSFSYTYWCAAQPDNTKDQCCMQMNTGDGKCWDDQPCNTLLPSVCIK